MNINELGFWMPIGSIQPSIYEGKKTVFEPINTEESPGLLHRFYISGDTSDIRSFLYFRVLWINSGMRTENGRWLKEWPEAGINKVLKLDNYDLMSRGVGLYFEVTKKVYAIRTEPHLILEDSSYRVSMEAFIPDLDAWGATQEQVIISPTSVDAIAAKVLESLSLLPPSP
jgi:hypothetical protein